MFNKKLVRVRLSDFNGDIVVEQENSSYKVWVEIQELNTLYWEHVATHTSLKAAMIEVANVIKLNAENDFYEE